MCRGGARSVGGGVSRNFSETISQADLEKTIHPVSLVYMVAWLEHILEPLACHWEDSEFGTVAPSLLDTRVDLNILRLF